MAYIGLKQLDPILTGSLQVSGSAGFTGSLSLRAGDKLFTEADEGTYLQSDSADRLRAVVGGSQMLLMDQDDGRVNIGYGQKLGVGLGNNTTPGVELEIDGDVSGSGLGSFGNVYAGTHITASGNISGSSTSTGSFGKLIGDGSSLINVFTGTIPSASISTRLTTEEANVDTLQSTMTSEQTNIDNLQTDSGSFSTRITTAESELGNTLISGSAQLATDISGSWQGSIDISSDTNLVGGTNITLTGDTLNVDDAFLINDGNDTTSGTITAGGFTTTATGSFGRLEADVLEANTLVISSSVTNVTIATKSGSTEFGDSADDTHTFTGNVTASANISASGTVTADTFVGNMTGAVTGDATGLTGTPSISVAQVTASGNISGSSTSTGSFGYLNISGNSNFIGDLTLGGNITIGDATTDSVTVAADFTSHLIPNANVTYDLGSSSQKWRDGFMASLVVSSSASGSTAITTNNITNGYPTSNPWGQGLDGSYFNNFDNTSHVSEILRFVAGIISHSIDTSSPTANTKYWNTLSTSHTEGSTTSKGSLLDGVLGSTYENARLSQHWTSSVYIDMSDTGSYRELQDYLTLKGWVLASDRGDFGNDTGTNPFHGSYASRIPSTILTQATHGTNSHTVTANAGGSSTVYSNSNYFGMGGLTSGGATPFYVRVLASHSFSDNYADSTPDEDSTYTTASYVDYSISSFTTSNGLVLAKIESANPAVIPAAYQDGDFNSVAGPISGRFYTGGATSATSISASGYYATHDIVTGLKSGSQADYVFKNGSDSNTRFYLYYNITEDITTSQPTAVVTSSAQITAFAATSRSLSGAPYLLTTTYTVTFDSEVSKSFDPCYGYASSPLVNSNTTDTWENIGSTTLSNTTVSVTNSGVQSTSGTLYVVSQDKGTTRGSNAVPHRSDIAVASSSLSFTLDSNTENIDQNRSSDESQNYSLVFRARGRNWKNTAVDSSSGTLYLYDAARFGQVAASGSMAVYSRAQGYDTNTLQDLTETFTGEDFRIVLADNVQAFNGAYFTTDSFQTNDEGDSVLGDYDLQVKPGYLVEPGGDYGYWFPEDFGSGTYKYYIRRFEKSAGTKTSMTVDVGKTLVNWNATTSDSVAVALLLESSGNGSGNNSSLGTARIFDPSDLTSNVIETNVAADNFKNPFSTAIDLYGNVGGSKSSTEYTLPIRNADGMYLDSNDNQLYVIIRYKGDPSPVTSITLSYS